MKLLSKAEKQECIFQLHPRAVDAEDFYKKISKKCSLDKISLHNIEHLFQKNRTYYARRIGKNPEVYIFSGFEFLQFSPQFIASTDANIILYPELSPEEIEEIAWAGVFKSIFSSVDYPKALSEIQLLSSELIANHKYLPFRFSDNKLSTIFNLHRSSTSKQKKKLKEKLLTESDKKSNRENIPSTFPSIFENLK